MKHILRKVLATMVCILMMSSTVFAQIETTAETATKVYTLSLEEAITMALNENPQLEAFEVEQKSNAINLDAAKKTKKKYDKISASTSNYEIMYVKKGYYVDTYEMLMRLNTKESEQAKSNIAYNVTSSYFNYKIATELCQVTENAYQLACENFDNVTKRYELGMIAEIDLKNAQLSVEQCKNTLDTYKRNSEIAKENLKVNLQLDGENCDFILTEALECGAFSADINTDIERAMENRYDVTALKESYTLAQQYFEYTKPLTSGSAKYQTAYSDLIAKEYSYTNNKKLIALSIKNSYYSVLNAADSLATAQKSTEIAKQKYEINKIKFENGMITNSELTSSLNDYLNSGISLENAELTYKLAVEKYQYEIAIGL